MKKTILKMLSLVLAGAMLASVNTVAFAADIEPNKNVMEFGDILYADNGITVFYGNPNEDEELAERIETQAARSLQYDNIWVDAHTTRSRTAYIYATSSNPLTYYTVRQEANSPVESSWVTIERPTNDGFCFMVSWDGRTTVESADNIISTSTLYNSAFNKKYAWTTGALTLNWSVTTGDSGARMNLWAW